MIKKILKKLKKDKTHNVTIFSESPLKTSFYEELQKNGWCNIVNDKPDNLIEEKCINLKDRM